MDDIDVEIANSMHRSVLLHVTLRPDCPSPEYVEHEGDGIKIALGRENAAKVLRGLSAGYFLPREAGRAIARAVRNNREYWSEVLEEINKHLDEPASSSDS